MPKAAMSRSVSSTSPRFEYALTIACGAFLLFQVQLLMGKYILPWFGGTPAVWTTCMLFFQVLLLGGYLYSHILSTTFPGRTQAIVHLAFLGLSILVICLAIFFWKTPLLPGASWKPTSPDQPVLHILTLLTVAVGLPYLILSTTGPLLQNWFSLQDTGKSPYRLYALSNVGSVLGLITYPIIFEPQLRLHTQAWLWCGGYLLFVAGSSVCALGMMKQPPAPVTAEAGPAVPSPSWSAQLFWFLLPMAASVMLLATTNLMCQEVAVIPFLWAVPLVLYLLTFIICFDNQKWYRRGVFHTLFGLSLPVALLVLLAGTTAPIFDQICMLSAVLFACCMVCHGELVRLKPERTYLTRYYLLLSAGGAAGGVFVAVIAPHVFRGYTEYQIGLIVCALLLAGVLYRDRQSWWYAPKSAVTGILILLGLMLVPDFFRRTIAIPPMLRAMDRFQYYPFLTVVALLTVLIVLRSRKPAAPPTSRFRLTQIASGIVLFALCFALYEQTYMLKAWDIRKDRNFYGVLTVQRRPIDDKDALVLRHGQTLHGAQYLDSPASPTAYYGPHSGVGLLLAAQSACLQPCSRTYGVVGMGVGTLAAYGQPGINVRFYEINPRVIEYSQGKSPYFTFLRDSSAKTETVLGDGRLSLERELEEKGPQKFDVLVLDAFNSDSIPMHLLTEEAFQLYLSHLRGPDSVLAFNITNKAIDLRPVLLSHALRHQMSIVRLNRPQGPGIDDLSDWILISKNPKSLDIPGFQGHLAALPSPDEALRWTDDYSNLFELLRKR
ncbi:MAG TPA: hypothetical protein VKH81_03760 [Candidatus Angelobacter sp.]|nr:hypothetical protein [Candidatus Angelobacter sp.]